MASSGEAQSGEDPEAEAKPDEHRQHLRGLLKAAAIACARLVCHRDTWTFVIEQTSQHPHFRHPDQVSDLNDGQIETILSGRSLLAILVTMRKVLDDCVGEDSDLATWALADAVYRRTQMAVAEVKYTRPDGSEVTTIVLDDRPAPADAS
ncbi:hypothetical protein [Streptomyces sp. Rer75]|uniref:hypothetical protein n=1 Tax=Streptomyces sp. Rer75 TaxID=2750011 RepID=UPI0015D05BDE|nr:hypothetical protein [Streptomyces sp. Rer75]QLH19285.1 hypothetical protein HYQ63_00050 [Streptomyces sp. Rer75]